MTVEESCKLVDEISLKKEEGYSFNFPTENEENFATKRKKN